MDATAQTSHGSHVEHASHVERFEHTGPAIREEYYPQYASVTNTVTPLYATEVYLGSAIILLSMCMLGLPITALGYWNDDMGVSMTLAIIAVVANVVVFLIGLGLCMHGFRKHARGEGHH